VKDGTISESDLFHLLLKRSEQWGSMSGKTAQKDNVVVPTWRKRGREKRPKRARERKKSKIITHLPA